MYGAYVHSSETQVEGAVLTWRKLFSWWEEVQKAKPNHAFDLDLNSLSECGIYHVHSHSIGQSKPSNNGVECYLFPQTREKTEWICTQH